jgi:hypothetical protein
MVKKRLKREAGGQELFAPRVYLLYQFKREEEIELLRAVYGKLFFQVSVYSTRGARVEYLARKFAGSEYSSQTQRFKDKAEKLISMMSTRLKKRTASALAKYFMMRI